MVWETKGIAYKLRSRALNVPKRGKWKRCNLAIALLGNVPQSMSIAPCF